MTAFNILFTSAGKRVSLLRLFRKALDNLGLAGSLIAADCQRSAAALFVADKQVQLPFIASTDYIPVLKEVCEQHAVRMLVPLIDTDLIVLADHKEEFARNGTTVLISNPEVVRTCRDKRLTHHFLRRAGFQTPELLDPATLLARPEASFPVFLKPISGSASIGATRINNVHELSFFLNRNPDALVEGLLVGREFTLDILVDFHGVVRCVVPRWRMETRAGEVSKGITTKDPRIIAAGKRLGEALVGAFGCLTAQCCLTEDGVIKFFEVNPRFGGGFPLAAEAGADFPRWLIEMILGRTPEIALDGWRDGVVMLRYDEAIFTTREAIS